MVNEVIILYILPLTTKGNSGHQNYLLATVCQDVYTKHSTYPRLVSLSYCSCLSSTPFTIFPENWRHSELGRDP